MVAVGVAVGVAVVVAVVVAVGVAVVVGVGVAVGVGVGVVVGIAVGVGVAVVVAVGVGLIWSHKGRDMICQHPELIPTKWNQQRPEPKEMTKTCQCGQNQICIICGWGFGSIPCKCEAQYLKDQRSQNDLP